MSRPHLGNDPEAGFTLLEILVALLIVSVIGSLVLFGVSRSQYLLQRISQSAARVSTMLQVDQYSRKMIGRVKVPFWEGAIDLDGGGERCAVPYLDGNPEKHLIIERKGDFVTIGTDTDQAARTFGPFSLFGVETLSDSEGHTVGLTLSYATPGDTRPDVSIVARFGGVSLWATDEDR